MNKLFVPSLFVLTAATAIAQPAPPPAEPVPPPVAKLTPPPGWQVDEVSADRVARALGTEAPFAGVPLGVDAQVWKAPAGGAALITTQVITEALPPDPGAAASAALRDLRSGADAVDGARVVRFDLAIDPAGKLHQASLEWSDPGVGTTTIARAMVFRRAGALVRVTGECVVTADGAAERPACEAVLATLQPSTASLEALVLTDAPATAPPTAAGEPARLSARDGEIPATLAINKPKARTDPRPYYLAGGLVVLALVFWWNRRQREQLAAAERAEDKRRERAEARRADNAKADDAKADDTEAADAEADDAKAAATDAAAADDRDPQEKS